MSAEKIKQLALSSGFDLCGITSAELIPEARAHYRAWLEKGYQADMVYLESWERRTDPRLVVAHAESVIMLGINYFSAQLPEAKEYRIARYARGRDYHKYIQKLLKQFHKILSLEFPEYQFRYFVDYGPFVERSYAEKAGLGFIGKNGLIITKEFGSYIFLAEIVTTMPLTQDTPAKRSCGTCTRCLDGCPTGALEKDNFLNAAKCISYQTIENKTDSIPEDIRKNMSGWVFGCDTCQEVCPFNNPLRIKETKHLELQPRYTSIEPSDPALTSDEAFLEKFQGTPLMRAKRRGLLRNIHLHNSKTI